MLHAAVALHAKTQQHKKIEYSRTGQTVMYKWSSWCGGTPALFSCFRKYSRLLALDTTVLIPFSTYILFAYRSMVF